MYGILSVKRKRKVEFVDNQKQVSYKTVEIILNKIHGDPLWYSITCRVLFCFGWGVLTLLDALPIKLLQK